MPRFRIRTLMIAVAVVAAICTWPKWFVLAAEVTLGVMVSIIVAMVLIHFGARSTKAGPRLFEWCVVVCLIGMILMILRQ